MFFIQICFSSYGISSVCILLFSYEHSVLPLVCSPFCLNNPLYQVHMRRSIFGKSLPYNRSNKHHFLSYISTNASYRSLLQEAPTQLWNTRSNWHGIGDGKAFGAPILHKQQQGVNTIKEYRTIVTTSLSVFFVFCVTRVLTGSRTM